MKFGHELVSNSEVDDFLQVQGNQGIVRRRGYVAQAIPQIDVEIAKQGHFWVETGLQFNFQYKIV